MALLDWLSTRQPEAPVSLRVRIAEVVAVHPEWNAMPPADALLEAGEILMRDVLAAAPKDRKAALDLLAADACVTYAFEAASDAPTGLPALADDAIHRIAMLSGSP